MRWDDTSVVIAVTESEINANLEARSVMSGNKVAQHLDIVGHLAPQTDILDAENLGRNRC